MSKLTSVKNNISELLPVIIITSLTFTAGLAWNDAFQSVIKEYIPEKYATKYGSLAKVIYAFTLTISIILLIAIIFPTYKKK